MRPLIRRWPTLVLWMLVAFLWALTILSTLEARAINNSLCALELARTAEGCR